MGITGPSIKDVMIYDKFSFKYNNTNTNNPSGNGSSNTYIILIIIGIVIMIILIILIIFSLRKRVESVDIESLTKDNIIWATKHERKDLIKLFYYLIIFK